jgi:heat shock protein HslJ
MRHRLVRRRLFLSIAAAGFLSVAPGCNESPTSPSDLIGETWRLVEIERSGLPSIPAPTGREFTIEFLDAARISVRADCNSCSGTYELLDEARVTIQPLACTRAFCGNDSLDTLYLQALSEARGLRRNGDELTIRSDDIALRFTLR